MPSGARQARALRRELLVGWLAEQLVQRAQQVLQPGSLQAVLALARIAQGRWWCKRGQRG